MDELNILESDPAVDVDKVKKNLNFDESKRIEEEEVQIPDEILSLPPNQNSDKFKSKPETEDGFASKSEFKEPEIWHQSENEGMFRKDCHGGLFFTFYVQFTAKKNIWGVYKWLSVVDINRGSQTIF